MSKRLVELEVPYVLPGSFDSALLWHSTWSFCSCDDLRPSWTGFMQDVSTGTHPPPSDITMLPIIDLNPSECFHAMHYFRPTPLAEGCGNH